jgi:hypothetical protein
LAQGHLQVVNFRLPFKAFDFHGDAFAVTISGNHFIRSQVYEQLLATNYNTVRIVRNAPAVSDKDSMDKIMIDVFCWHGGSFRFPVTGKLSGVGGQGAAVSGIS